MRRALLVFASAVLGVAAFAPSAAAHALLRASDPEEGAELREAPRSIRAEFTEEPELAFSSLQVLDTGGARHERGVTRKDGSALMIDVGDVPDGVYTVAWRVISKVDGHATGGAFVFGVGVSPAEAEPASVPAAGVGAPSAWEVAGRWTLFVGLGLLIGSAWIGAAAFGGTPGGVWRSLGVGWLASAAGVVVLAEAQRRSTGAGFGVLLGTSLGRALMLRAAGVAAAGVAVLVARARTGRARAAALWAAGMAAAGVVVVHVAAGHAAAGGATGAKVALQALHVVAGGVWIGGLAALLAGTRGAPSDQKSRAVRRFSTVAGAALFVVLGTGVVRALNEIPSWGDLVSTSYGVVVVVKVTLLVVLATLGGLNRYVNVRRARESLEGLRRVSRVEVGIGATVLVAAALLASLVPPRSLPAAVAGEGPITVEGADFATSVRVVLEIEPGRAGANAFTARVTDFDTRAAVDAERVALRFAFLDDPSVGESELALRRTGAGIYGARGGAMSLDGAWRVTVLVQRAADAVEVPLRTATRCRQRARSFAGQPTLHDTQLAGGRTAQGYVSRAGAGHEVHITFFDPQGAELDVPETPVMTALSRGATQEPSALAVRRLSAGHFVGDASLGAGTYRFDIVGGGSGEEEVRACFEDEIA